MVQVTVKHLGLRAKTFKVAGMTAEGAAQLKFCELVSNRWTNVARYFEERYGKRCVQYFLVHVEGRLPKRHQALYFPFS